MTSKKTVPVRSDALPLDCEICGRWLTRKNSAGIGYASSHYNGTNVCDSCVVEHCLRTDCIGCDWSSAPEQCEFIDMKAAYLQNTD